MPKKLMKTECKINGTFYLLEYLRTAGDVNVYFWGALHLKDTLEFSFKITGNNKIIFTPLNTANFIVEAITNTLISSAPLEKNLNNI